MKPSSIGERSVVSGFWGREGNPEKEVLGLAGEIDAGLIVTGGKRRPWFERILGAGFSEHVFKRADRPVLVISGREHESSALPRYPIFRR